MVRVLLVEDMAATHDLVRETLRIVGGFQEVGCCTTENGALGWLHEHEGGCDLAIVDLMLREGSGFSVVTRAVQTDVPVVVFSDFATPAVASKCLSLGASGVVSKDDYRALRVFLEGWRGRQRLAA